MIKYITTFVDNESPNAIYIRGQEERVARLLRLPKKALRPDITEKLMQRGLQGGPLFLVAV